MKKINIKILGTVAGCLLAVTSFSQNWRLGGNNAGPPPNGVNAGNNTFGTNVNVPIKIATNGVQRMHINQNTGLTNGFIGMGNGFNNPQSHLHINNPLNE